ncbi:AAA family ATPase [Desulfococcus sp.]|uniref:AAA family ATPase n=1 Tax=Desulfococcus sp. TaxID=2025834 RepID=UPI003593E378
MLTRLKVTGFKNLVDVDVRFGPFTCIAGANGVGKSNLFDAIRFLSALSNDTLLNAALSVRDAKGKTSDIRNIFHRSGDNFSKTMTFEAEMIIPKEGIDDLGQTAKASITFVRYALKLAYRTDENLSSLGSLEIIEEKLERVNLGDAPNCLKFPHKVSSWRKSVLEGRRTAPFISTEDKNGKGPEDKNEKKNIIELHQDGGGGRPKKILADKLPRTVLSTVNATESPTALIVRKEIQSWRLLQLEPSALREPDDFTTPPGMGANGSHLPATLYALSKSHQMKHQNNAPKTWVYDQITHRLSELIDDVYSVTIDRDEKRQLLTLNIMDSLQTIHPARSLSDGTLRFLALAVLQADPKSTGLICLEEPENGIHPDRIPAILELLKDIATDANESVGPDNPLRQVIINTHSPSVVKLVPEGSLLVAELKEVIKNRNRLKGCFFSWLPDTWRSEAEPKIHPVPLGRLLSYLDTAHASLDDAAFAPEQQARRVIDRPDLKQMQLGFEEQC